MAQAPAGVSVIVSPTAEVEGVKLHYLTAGYGLAVILLHGYTQTSRMWRPLIPRLAEKFKVRPLTSRESVIRIFRPVVWI